MTLPLAPLWISPDLYVRIRPGRIPGQTPGIEGLPKPVFPISRGFLEKLLSDSSPIHLYRRYSGRKNGRELERISTGG